MALISCPECNHQISDTALFCPNCGYVLSTKADASSITKKKESHKKVNVKKYIERIYNFVLYIIKLEWADDILDFLREIPIIGWLISAIFGIFVVVGSIGLVVFCIGFLLYLIGKISPFFTAFICCVAAILIAYYASYGSGQRRKWYFWVSLALWAPCAFFCLFGGLIDIIT